MPVTHGLERGSVPNSDLILERRYKPTASKTHLIQTLRSLAVLATDEAAQQWMFDQQVLLVDGLRQTTTHVPVSSLWLQACQALQKYCVCETYKHCTGPQLRNPEAHVLMVVQVLPYQTCAAQPLC